MRKRIAVFGASVHAFRIAQMIENSGDSTVVCFVTNNERKQGKKLDGKDIISFPDFSRMPEAEGEKPAIVISAGNPASINDMVDQLRAGGVGTDVYVLSRRYWTRWPRLTTDEALCAIDVSKPRFDYIEYHVADHCNLKCKGCGHLSNVAKPAFGNLGQFRKDLIRLKELFWGIERIRLMGGEPLLNPELPEFIASAREAFPDTNIRVVSNGLLIPRADDRLLRTMRDCDAGFDVSQYPPTQSIKEDIELRCMENEVQLSLSPLITEFHRRKKEAPPDAQTAFDKCASSHCHFLLDGKISLCPGPILSKRFSDIVERVYFEEDIIDLYDKSLTGFALNEVFSKPNRRCAFCGNYEQFEWEGNYPRLI